MSLFTYCLTFGDRSENHHGMVMKGTDVGIGNGFNKDDLINIMKHFEKNKCKCELIELNKLLKNHIDFDYNNIESAFILIVRNMIDGIIYNDDDDNYDDEHHNEADNQDNYDESHDSEDESEDESQDNDNESDENEMEESQDEVVKENSIITLTKEMESFKWDDKYWDKRRKKVLNKHARENVCFDDYSSEPNYEEKKGRIVGWNDVPTLNKIRKNIEIIAGKKGMNLKCEGNKYKNDIGKDKKNGGIGWHGDAERRKVWALRIGEKMVLKYNWWHNSKPIGDLFEVELNSGDGYIMSEKAVGYDWLKKKIYTLRHSAGSTKYVSINK